MPPAVPRPFRFSTSLVLYESTGLRASTLPTLVKLLRVVPEACIYHHTHDFLLQHHYLTPEPSNDFAYWAAEVLGEKVLGERLAGIDILEHETVLSLRQAILSTVEGYLAQNPTSRLKFAAAGQEFFFVKSVHVVLPTRYTASTLAEFALALQEVSINSLYFHMFGARLRVGRLTNDFAIWLTEQLGLKDLGDRIFRLDPYGHTLEALRSILLGLVREELGRHDHA